MKDRRSPGKTLMVPVALSLIMMLCSFGLVQDELIIQNDQKVEINKKDVMLNILESLESGKPYYKDEIWKGSNYAVIELPAIELPDFSDFDFDFNFEIPEFDFDELQFKEFELRMEELQKKIDIRMQDMIRRIELLHEKHFENFEIEI